MSVKIDKPKKVISKRDKYPNERQNVLSGLYNILGITETNKIFYLDDLEKDINKQNQIIELVPDIKKYFAYGMWSYFAKPQLTEKRYLSLAKSLIKDMGHKIYSITEKGEGKIIRYGVKIE